MTCLSHDVQILTINSKGKENRTEACKAVTCDINTLLSNKSKQITSS